MVRPIYELFANGQKVLINGQRGLYLVSQSLKKNVFKAYVDGTFFPYETAEVNFTLSLLIGNAALW
jgi:hypothetical protein